MAKLANSAVSEDAAPVEQTIWEVFLTSGDGAVGDDMLRGLQAFMAATRVHLNLSGTGTHIRILRDEIRGKRI